MEGRKGFPTGKNPSVARPVAIRNPYATGRTGSRKSNTNVGSKSASAMKAPSVGNHHKQQQQQQQEQQQQHQQQQSNELAYWERLPSRSVSFGPAEVLTVTECLKVGRLYCGRSVRTTGILHSVVPGRQMELKDITTTRGIAEAFRRKNENHKRIRSSKKRPWFVVSSNNDRGISINNQPRTTLRVIVDPSNSGTCLSKASVGSLITVIGEFFLASEHRYDLEARTLTVSGPTTNMVLYQKALHLRRKSVYERYYSSNNDQKNNIATADQQELLQGCGPPPYDAFRRDHMEKQTKQAAAKTKVDKEDGLG